MEMFWSSLEMKNRLFLKTLSVYYYYCKKCKLNDSYFFIKNQEKKRTFAISQKACALNAEFRIFFYVSHKGNITLVV